MYIIIMIIIIIYIYMHAGFSDPNRRINPKIIGTSPCRAPLRLVTAAPPQGQQVPQALPTWSLPRAARFARWVGSRRRLDRTALLVNYYQLEQNIMFRRNSHRNWGVPLCNGLGWKVSNDKIRICSLSPHKPQESANKLLSIRPI